MEKQYRKNIDLLRPYLGSNLLNILEGVKSTELVLFQKNSNFNNNFQQLNLYSPSVEEFCSEQLDAYLNNKHEIVFGQGMQVEAPVADDFSRLISKLILEKAQSSSLYCTQEPEFDIRGFFVSVGLGIGTHVQLAQEKFNFKNLVIIEPVLEFFIANLLQNDWSSIVGAIENNNGHIHFIINDDANLISSSFISIMNGQDYALIEGSMIYCHYHSKVIDQVLYAYSKSRDQIVSYNGWLEDEYEHLKNHLRNTMDKDYLVLDNLEIAQKKHVAKDHACFIIASGPSLDHSISAIKKLGHKATIFSCGSALGPLLQAGICPDFHVELENSETVYNIITTVAMQHDLSRISLICPTNAAAGLGIYFKARLNFIREGHGFIKALPYGHTQLQNTAPSPTNTALKIANIFGFKTCFLFGTDFGYIDGRHHSQNNIYDQAIEKIGIDIGIGSGNMTDRIMVPGNFSDKIETNSLWVFMRNALEFSVGLSRFKIFNCSQGAKISGTQALSNDQLDSLDFPDKPDFFNMRLESLFSQHNNNLEDYKSELNQLLEVAQKTSRQLKVDIKILLDKEDVDLNEETICRVFEKYFYSSFLPAQNTLKNSFKAAFGASFVRIFHAMRYISLRHRNVAEAWRFCIEELGQYEFHLTNRTVDILQNILSVYGICERTELQEHCNGYPLVSVKDMEYIDELLMTEAVGDALLHLTKLERLCLPSIGQIVTKRLDILNKFENAESILDYMRGFSSIYPRDLISYQALHNFSKLHGYSELAFTNAEAAINFFPNDPQSYNLYASAARYFNDLPKVFKIADIMILKFPDSPNGYAQKGLAYLTLNKIDNAIEMQKAIATIQSSSNPPSVADVDLFEFDLASALGDINKAEKVAQRAVNFYDSPPIRYLFELKVLMEKREYVEAIKLCENWKEEGHDFSPGESLYAKALGMCHPTHQ